MNVHASRALRLQFVTVGWSLVEGARALIAAGAASSVRSSASVSTASWRCPCSWFLPWSRSIRRALCGCANVPPTVFGIDVLVAAFDVRAF